MLPTDFEQRFEMALASYYEDKQHLNEAILYALLGPGKRLRPKLVYLCALAAGAKNADDAWSHALAAMLAIEMVHCYSLVHDDLPAMDNDDYRRGRLSCHKKYSEAIGILVGDALNADAFAVLSTSRKNALLQVRELAQAIGSRGMVLGQQADLAAQPVDTTWEQWRDIHSLKTGKLFECACVMGALSVDASREVIEQLRQYARVFGVAFQLKDDLIDSASTVSVLGSARVEALLKENVDAATKIATNLKSEDLVQVARQLLAH